MRNWQQQLACVVVVVAAGIGAAGAQERLAIRAGAYLDAEGKRVDNAVLIINKGKIEDIGSDLSIPTGVTVLDRSHAVLGPGLVDPHVSLGAMGRTAEAADAVERDADAAALFNPNHADFEKALRAGVTTVVLAPSETHLVGGVTAVVKTGGDNAGRMLGAGPMKLSLAQTAFNMSRTPTSLQGGLAELRSMIAEAKDNRADDSAFAKWARGESAALVELSDAAGLTALAEFAKEQGVKCITLHGNLAAERLDAVTRLGQPVVLGTYEFSDPRRYTRAPAMLMDAGVPVALTSNAPQYAADWLRIGAVIEMQQGMSRTDALKSVTTTPATIAGVADRVGALAKGMDADFVVYSGAPLDLRSRILEVFINGQRVYVADEPPAKPEDDDA
ncbi:MAG: amidohydrolase family protein [Phycisphaerales bacterium]|nr:amidohydrolase family protein [Phycisphaerales bacterium]MCB9864422.1 amidohydrolase family protein [Phycisphaerales bacterium]